MDLELRAKTALVTGGSAGIGLACGLALVAEGVSVMLVGRDAARLASAHARATTAARDGAAVETVAADLATPAGVAAACAAAEQRFGRVDILINSAGAAQAGAFLDLPEDAFLSAWNLKLLGYLRMIRALAPGMVARRDGRIVNIVGGAGRTPRATFIPGSTSNAALLNMTRGLAAEFARHNVRINAISPGATATERAERLIQQEAAATGKAPEALRTARDAAIPIGHLVKPEEIAAMACLLVSDRVGSLTGAEIVVDGGQQPGV